MANIRWWIAGGLALCLAGPGQSLKAAGPAPGKTAAAAKSGQDDVQALAARIDQYLAARWAAAGVQPAPLADDAEYLRRVYLDIIGRIPSVREARDFLKDKSPDKRAKLVERLLASPSYVNHFTNEFRALFLAEADTSFIGRFLVPGFESWLKRELGNNVGYDRMVRQILTTAMNQESQQIFNFNAQGEPNPGAFYISKEIKPENLAASTARMFLGVRLECAQCHDHPFATWKREQFWGLAAFFAGLQRQEQGDFALPTREINDRREIAIPGTEKVVQASFIDGSEPQWKFKIGSRVTLADWVTSPNNPYFARAAANRLWAHFFGLGLTEPIDDMVGSETVAHHPELLDELAHQFAAHQFDLKFLIRALTATKVYQLTSAAASPSLGDTHLFTHMALKSMSPEQLFDSLAMAINYPQQQSQNPYFVFNDNSPRTKFLDKFANRNEKKTETQTSILQALALMNNKFVDDATSLQRSERLAAIADAPFMDTAEKIETLFLSTLSRKPRPDELKRLTRYINNGGTNEVSALAFAEAIKKVINKEPNNGQAPGTKDNALADVFWALLNSSEFILNH